MHLATLFVTLDLDPEVNAQDRERVLRSLRDRLKQAYGSRITVRSDDDSALAISFFDDILERAKSRVNDILEKIEGASQARIDDHVSQTFTWFDGCFQETKDEIEEFGKKRSSSSYSGSTQSSGKTIRYAQDDDDEELSAIPSRFSRKNFRIPTRK